MNTPYIVRQFTKDYGLPVFATIVFAAILLFLFASRVQERSALANVLSTNAVNGNSYADLLSNDTIDDLTQNNTQSDENTNGEPQPIRPTTVAATTNSTAPFTISPAGSTTPSPSPNPSPTPSPTPTTPTPTPTPTPPPPPPPPVAPFTSSIQRFTQESASLNCTNGNSFKFCSKTYNFRATVATSNGPGTVSYAWQSSVAASSKTGSFTVNSGEASTTLSQQVTLSCLESNTFTIRFVTVSPTVASSNVITVQHSCV